MIKKRKKILLIDDDLTIADIYKTIIKKSKFDIEIISSGEKAIERIKNIIAGKELKIDIILLDLVLPDINGIEVFKVIKENSATKDIKIFILTNQQDFVDWPNDIRPDEFLIKVNINPTHLLKLIKSYLE